MTSYPESYFPINSKDIDVMPLTDADEIAELIRVCRYGKIEDPKDKLGFGIRSRITRLIRRVFNY